MNSLFNAFIRSNSEPSGWQPIKQLWRLLCPHPLQICSISTPHFGALLRLHGSRCDNMGHIYIYMESDHGNALFFYSMIQVYCEGGERNKDWLRNLLQHLVIEDRTGFDSCSPRLTVYLRNSFKNIDSIPPRAEQGIRPSSRHRNSLLAVYDSRPPTATVREGVQLRAWFDDASRVWLSRQ